MNILKEKLLISTPKHASTSMHEGQPRHYRKPFLVLTTFLLAIITLVSCGMSEAGQSGSGPSSQNTSTDTSEKVTIVGSTALLPLVAKAGDLYHQSHPNVQIKVTGGGSLAGLDAVMKQKADIAASDVYADPAVYPDPNLTDHIVCATSFAVIVDPGVTVTSLSTQQISDIFTGKITNWQDVGGPNLPITLVIRPATSGTHVLFSKYILDGATESTNATSVDSSTAVLDTVAHTSGAISYVATTTVNSSVHTMNIDGVSPTVQTIQAGKYKFWGYEHMYTLQNGVNATTSFLDFMKSPQIQQLAQQLGYIPINAVKSVSPSRAVKSQIKRTAGMDISSEFILLSQ